MSKDYKIETTPYGEFKMRNRIPGVTNVEADFGVPDELIGRIENLLANLYCEKERLRIERSWELSPDRMGK